MNCDEPAARLPHLVSGSAAKGENTSDQARRGHRLRGGEAPVGLVIGTHAALPYIHLQLEARRRLYPNVLTLVHDDGSRQGAEIEALAHEYGAEFVTHPVRHHHHLGDLSIYPVALTWAASRKLRFLLKVSRRWIWQVDWREDLLRLFESTQAPTASNFTESYAFGFRTECVAFDVRRWNSIPDGKG